MGGGEGEGKGGGRRERPEGGFSSLMKLMK